LQAGRGRRSGPEFITRLRGIGYTGYVTLEWEKAWLPALAEPEEILPDSITKLKSWLRDGAEENGEVDSGPVRGTTEAKQAVGAS